MDISEWLSKSSTKLKDSGITTARLDCLILLEDTIKHDRTWILANQELELLDKQIAELNALISRRAKHEPLAYIRGKSAFYGREFFVSEHTLQPRPETETMIELLISVLKNKQPPEDIKTIVDVGTGSGCIAITAKLELPNLNVIATDISEPCLKIARKNTEQFGTEISLIQTNLISNIDASKLKDAILCCNLPYVPDSFTINQAAMFEPEIAIFGGKDGLDYFRQLFDQLKNKQAKPLAILTEGLPTQHDSLEKIANQHNYALRKTQDFIQLFAPLK